MEQAKDTTRAAEAQADRAAMAVLEYRDAESNALHFVLGYMFKGDGKGLDGSVARICDGIESARHMFVLTDEQVESVEKTLNVRRAGGAA